MYRQDSNNHNHNQNIKSSNMWYSVTTISMEILTTTIFYKRRNYKALALALFALTTTTTIVRGIEIKIVTLSSIHLNSALSIYYI